MGQTHFVGIIVEEEIEFTLDELCQACAVTADRIAELIEAGLATPIGREAGEWRFAGTELRRLKIALRLQNDLSVNVAGAALALQLMDEISELRAQIEALRSLEPSDVALE